MEYNKACNVCSQGTLRAGARQVRKIVINSNMLKSKSIDILALRGYRKPNIYIISRKLKNVLETYPLSGYKLAPCLEKGPDYSEGDRKFHTKIDSFYKNAKYFQMIITKSIVTPPKVGISTDFIPVCTNCNTHPGTFISMEPCFRMNDLLDVDFQNGDEYISDNLGRFVISGSYDIISKRVVKLFIENKIKGLIRYMTDPPLKYGVVEIQEEIDRHLSGSL